MGSEMCIRDRFNVGRTFGSPHVGTVAILAQGTDWTVAVSQAFFVRGSIPAARRSCLASLVDQHLRFDVESRVLQNTCAIFHSRTEGVWRNGSTSDSRSEGWEFESLCPHFEMSGAPAAESEFGRPV